MKKEYMKPIVEVLTIEAEQPLADSQTTTTTTLLLFGISTENTVTEEIDVH